MKSREQQETNKLQHSDFQFVYDCSPNSIIAVDSNNVIVYTNPRALEKLKLTKGEAIGSLFNNFYQDLSKEQSFNDLLTEHQEIKNFELLLLPTIGEEQWVLINTTVFDDDDDCYTYIFISDINNLKKKERLLSYLNLAAEELAQARDTPAALKKISQLIVPKFANWFAIDVPKEGRLELLMLEHENPEKIKWAYEYRKNFPSEINSNRGIARVLNSGKPTFVPVVTEEMLMGTIESEAQLQALQKISIKSLIIVPMLGKGGITGAISFISSIEGRRYDESDLRFAQNFANHIGLALENAQLNEEALSEITQRKHIEDQLNIIQSQLQTALSSGLVGTWVKDLNKNILYPDESLSAMFGIPYTADGCDPEIFEKAIYQDNYLTAETKRQQAITEGGIYEIEYKAVNNNKTCWFFARGKTTYDDQQNPSLFTGVVVDITKRKEAEIALKESEERYGATFLNASVGILLADLNGNLLKANPAFTFITGYTENDLKGSNFKTITYPKDIEQNEELYGKLYNEEIFNFVIEKRYLHKTGHIIWVRNSTSLVRDSDGKPAYTISISEDITEQKRIQAELKKSEEVFRVLAESMPQKIFSTDASGNINYLNPRWEEFTNLSILDVSGLSLATFVHPEDAESTTSMWADAINTGTDFSCEHRLKNRNNEYIWHLTRALPLRDDNGNINRWIGTITDINDQKENEQKKDEFISIASHELKTPLTTVKAFFQLLQMEITEDYSLYKFVDKAAHQLDRLERLINDLLDVSKINSGKMQYNLEEFSVHQSLNEAIDSVQEISPSHTILLDKSPDLVYFGDKYRIEQVIVNLLNNAIKYSPEADKVILSADINDNHLIISVKDFGIGIAPDHLNELFERFYRVDSSSHRFQGLGLGLFISSEIVKRHKGILGVESEIGKGSTFYFRVPLGVTLE